jgi:hypothetical protein
MPRNESCNAAGISLHEQLGDIVSYGPARILRMRPDIDTLQFAVEGS